MTMQANVPRFDMMKAACPTRQMLDRVAGKWTMLVLLALSDGTLRFAQLRRTVEGITPKVLTDTVRLLERDGLIRRTAYPTVPVTVEYTITDLGRGLSCTIDALRSWAYTHMDEIDDARREFDARPAPDGPPTPRTRPGR